MNTKAFVLLFCTLFLIILIGLGVLFQKKISTQNQEIETETENELQLVGNEGQEELPDSMQEINNLGGNQQQVPPQEKETTMAKSNQETSAPEMSIDKNKTYSAVLDTTEGDITIEFTTKETPITVNNFVTLARKKFYNDTIFHRVIDGFMIQGGDPEGKGTGGPGYKFNDEPFDGEYVRGTVAMANSGPNTNGSQFFIMHKDSPLPKNYVIFGKVTEGLDVVDAIAEADVRMSASGEESQPVTPVRITSVEVIEE